MERSSSLIDVENVSFSFNGMEVLQEISFSISPGDFVALIGPNGSGKTTLIRVILGILRPTRGRVVIMYGTPDDIERHPSETETRPYEIWSYNNIQGGVIFVFVQRNTAGDYELVHSTHRNELHDENWDRQGITR